MATTGKHTQLTDWRTAVRIQSRTKKMPITPQASHASPAIHTDSSHSHIPDIENGTTMQPFMSKSDNTSVSVTNATDITAQSDEPTYSIIQCAEALGMGVPSLRAICKTGNIKAVPSGRSYRLTQSAIDEYVSRNPKMFKKPLSAYRVANKGNAAAASARTSVRAAMRADGLVSAKDIADMLNLTHWTVRDMERKGEIPSVRKGRNVLFDMAVIKKMVEDGRIAEGNADGDAISNAAAKAAGLYSTKTGAALIGMDAAKLRELADADQIAYVKTYRGDRYFKKSDLLDLCADYGVTIVPGVDWSSCVSMSEAARRLNTTRERLSNLCDNDRIGYVRMFFGRRMFRECDLARYEAKVKGVPYEGEDKDEPYVTQVSYERSLRKGGDAAEKTPEQVAEEEARAKAEAEERARIRQEQRDAEARAKREAAEQARRTAAERAEERRAAFLSRLTLSAVESMGNVVRMYLDEPNAVATAVPTNPDELESGIENNAAAIVTLAFPMDVECVTTDCFDIDTRAMLENGDVQALAILDSDSMLTADDVTGIGAVSSRHAKLWYLGDRFEMPAIATLIDCDIRKDDAGTEGTGEASDATDTAGETNGSKQVPEHVPDTSRTLDGMVGMADMSGIDAEDII